MNDFVKLALDMRHNRVQKYSVAEANETLRNALIEANGGSTKLNFRDYRSGKLGELFSIVEEIIDAGIVDTIDTNEFFRNLVEFRNIPAGDENLFTVRNAFLYRVAEIAPGTQGLRRQRIEDLQELSLPVKTYGVKIYEELQRILAGRVDFDHMIDVATKSFAAQILDEVYTLWSGIAANELGGAVYYYNAAGTYDEKKLLELVEHVEAASGMTATIVGTKTALRNLAPSVQGVDSTNDLYALGYYGKFYGSNCIAIPQRHKNGTTQFLMSDDVLTIVATDAKPIKMVYEGDPLIIMGDPLSNGDLTQEFTQIERFGLGIITTADGIGIGRYEIA